MSIEDEIKTLLNKQEQLEKDFDPFLAEQQRIEEEEKAAEEEYQRVKQELLMQFNTMRAKFLQSKAALNTSKFELQSEINQTKELIRQKQLALLEQQQQEKLEKERAARAAQEDALTKLWDNLTIGASWREWAKDHQIKAAHKITNDQKVILADPMGLGKTLSAIITCDMVEQVTKNASPENPIFGEEKEHYNYETKEYEVTYVNTIKRPVGRKVLYICPSSMIKNVMSEFRLWAKHRNVTFIGGMSKAERQFVFDNVIQNRADYVLICNYEAWRKDLSLVDSLIRLDFDTLIIDEAHNIKDTKSVAYRGIKRILDESNPEYVIPMTGTPILNRPQELFSLLTLVAPQRFYRLNDFLYEFCAQDHYTDTWQFKPGGLDRIAKSIAKNFLRRTKDQAGIELPSKTVTIHELELDEKQWPEQAKVRKQMRDFATIILDEKEGKAISATVIIALLTRLRQIETWPAGIVVKDAVTKEPILQVEVEESQKLDYIISYNKETKEFDGLIPEIIEDERIVLFSQFTAPLKELADRVTRMGKKAVILDGSASPELREQIRLDFDNRHTPNREDAKWDIVLCNYKVGGVGMNLTAATQMIILDEEWNPGKRDQAYDRIHRIGQDKPITIHVIRNLKTVDDWLSGIIETKEKLVEGFNNTMVSGMDVKSAIESGLI